MRVLGRDIRDDDTGTLDTRRFEDRDPRFVGPSEVFGYTIVADHGRGEDEDLTEVRWVGHRFRVCPVGHPKKQSRKPRGEGVRNTNRTRFRKAVYLQLVILVLKTVSPKTLLLAPNACPSYVWPDFKCNAAGS